jgi:hypothetical protein
MADHSGLVMIAEKTFHGFLQKRIKEKPEFLYAIVCADLCPCNMCYVYDLSPEIIFLRLDEVIDEIQEELDKETLTCNI